MKIAFLMDHISTIDQKADSTYMLMKEAQRRDFEIYHFTPKDLFLEGGEVKARIAKVSLFPRREDFFLLAKEEIVALEHMDMIFIRQDPPFNMHYVTTTYLLEKIAHKVFFVNHPTEVRNAPEKLLVCDYKEFMPATIVAEDCDIIKNFAEDYETIILKPLYACGGRGIAKLSAPYDNLEQKIHDIMTEFRTQIMVQEFRPEIELGDKRVILSCGKVMGQVLRVPAEGEVAANFHAGGVPKETDLTVRQREICDVLGLVLLEKKLYFVGLDFIGDYLTEINVTSPTGLQEINLYQEEDVTIKIWDEFINNYKKKND